MLLFDLSYDCLLQGPLEVVNVLPTLHIGLTGEAVIDDAFSGQKTIILFLIINNRTRISKNNRIYQIVVYISRTIINASPLSAYS